MDRGGRRRIVRHLAIALTQPVVAGVLASPTARASDGADASRGEPAAAAQGRGRPAASRHDPVSHWPVRPVVLIVPWPAGGPTDLTMRVLARTAGRELGIPVVVENRPGAAGAIAVGAMLAAAHDGYTIMQLPITVYRLPYLQKLSWDPNRDLIPILQVSEVTFGIVVSPDSPFHSVGDLVDYGRAHPGMLTVGSTGYASTPHLVMADLFEREGVDYIHVPYRGAIDQIFAVQSSNIMVGVLGSGFAPLVDEGRLRLLATFNATRSARWPEVPTVRELGYDIVSTSPYGIAAPRGVPPEIVARLHDAFRAATLDPEHVAELERYDQQVAYLDTAGFRRILAETIEVERRWSRLIPMVRP